MADTSSSSTPISPSDPISASDFREALHKFKDDLDTRSLRSGPHYCGVGGIGHQVWHDQVFEREIEPAGTVACSQALRVGATHNGLDIVLLASHANTTPIQFPAGATITASFLQGDSENGAFESVGPTICVKAPKDGIAAQPDCPICRFAIGNFQKPWLKVTLEFSGAITGGTCDCVLAHNVR